MTQMPILILNRTNLCCRQRWIPKNIRYRGLLPGALNNRLNGLSNFACHGLNF
jgi:hypothetical protein